MPARVIEEPLGIACWFSSGTRSRHVVRESRNPVLARELLDGLVELVHPHGSVDAKETVAEFTRAIKPFTDGLADGGYVGGAAGLTRARLVEYWWSGSSHRREVVVRRMLAALDDARGVLAPDVRRLVDGRASLGTARAGRWIRTPRSSGTGCLPRAAIRSSSRTRPGGRRGRRQSGAGIRSSAAGQRRTPRGCLRALARRAP